MSKEGTIVLEGVVEEILPNAMFRISIPETKSRVIGVISGKMRQNNIKILLGDKVDVEFSPYDISKGRVIRRK